MRTTVTLDPDVVRLLAEEEHRLRKPFKQVLNDAVRRALSPRRAGSSTRYEVPVFHARLRAGIDPRRMNQLVDELEVDAFLATESARGTRRAARKKSA